MKNKKKTPFVEQLEKVKALQYDKSLPLDERQERRYLKVDTIFKDIANKENRYLIYCPDIPFACSLVKIIYDYTRIMREAGYNIRILHEEDGFIPKWLDFSWVKDIPKDYLTSTKDKSYPEYKFRPSDTIIVPDGFFSIMKGFYNIKPLHKVVLALGYNGLSSMEPGVTWGTLGFNDVICLTEDIKNKYQELFPSLNYFVTGYTINEELLQPLVSKEVKPTIGLMIRDRELASKIVNIFTNKYPYFNFFQFKVLKKLSVKQYCEELKKCAVIVFVDDKSAVPAPLAEAICSNTPVITHYNRFLDNFVGATNIIVVEKIDEFGITDTLAEFCQTWSFTPTFGIVENKPLGILDNFKEESVKRNLIEVLESLQEEKIKTFTRIEKAISEGKIDTEEYTKNTL